MADRPMTDFEGSKGRRRLMVFGLVSAIALVVLILIGVASKNAAPDTAQLNTEWPAASGSQNP